MFSFSNILVTRCSGVRFPLGFWLFACFQAQSADSFGETAPSVSGCKCLRNMDVLPPAKFEINDQLACFQPETLGCFLDNVDLSWHVLPVAICPCSFEKTVIISVMVCIGGMKLWKILSFFSGQKI